MLWRDIHSGGENEKRDHKIYKTIYWIICRALGCMIILKADLGLSPWDVLHQGLSKTLGITIGQASIGLGLMIVVLDIFLGQPIGLGTVLNFMSIGVFMDLILYLDFLPVTDSLVLKVVMLLVGIFIYSYGIFLYMVQGMGCGPRDGFMQILTKRTKYSVGLIKNVIEVIAFSLGWLLGGELGLGTIVTALAMGIILEVMFKSYNVDVKELQHRNIKEEIKHLSKVGKAK